MLFISGVNLVAEMRFYIGFSCLFLDIVYENWIAEERMEEEEGVNLNGSLTP